MEVAVQPVTTTNYSDAAQQKAEILIRVGASSAASRESHARLASPWQFLQAPRHPPGMVLCRQDGDLPLPASKACPAQQQQSSGLRKMDLPKHSNALPHRDEFFRLATGEVFWICSQTLAAKAGWNIRAREIQRSPEAGVGEVISEELSRIQNCGRKKKKEKKKQGAGWGEGVTARN